MKGAKATRRTPTAAAAAAPSPLLAAASPLPAAAPARTEADSDPFAFDGSEAAAAFEDASAAAAPPSKRQVTWGTDTAYPAPPPVLGRAPPLQRSAPATAGSLLPLAPPCAPPACADAHDASALLAGACLARGVSRAHAAQRWTRCASHSTA